MTIPSEHRLYPYEWLTVTCIMGFLGMVTAIVLLSESDAASDPQPCAMPMCIQTDEIGVTIMGAVQNPGTYYFKKGSLLGDAIAVAKLKEDADLQKLNFKSKLRRGQVLNIPTVEMIEVYIEGFIESPILLRVPKGTCLKDLVKHLKMHPETDLNPILKKRKLKDQERIILKQRKKR